MIVPSVSSAGELISPISHEFAPSNVTSVMTFGARVSLITANVQGYILCLDIVEEELSAQDRLRIQYSRRYILVTIVECKFWLSL